MNPIKLTEENVLANTMQGIKDLLLGGLTSRNMREFRQFFVVNHQDSLDPDHPMLVPFNIPGDITRMIRTTVTFWILPFRAYSKAALSNEMQTTSSGGGFSTTSAGGGAVSTTTADGGGTTETSSSVTTPSGGGHTTPSGGGHTCGSTATPSGGGHTTPSGGGHTSGTKTTPSGGEHTTPSGGGHTSGASSIANSVYEGAHGHSVHILNSDEGTTVKVYESCGNYYFNAPTGGLRKVGILNPTQHRHGVDHTHVVGNHTHSVSDHIHPSHDHTVANHTHSVSDHGHPSHAHAVNNHQHSVSNHSHPAHTHTVTLADHKHGFSISSHTHGVTVADHTHTVAAHDHAINFGIYEEQNSPKVSFALSRDGVIFGTHVGTYEENQVSIEISSLVDTPGPKILKFESTERARLAVQVEVKFDARR